jgi:hypothetical protein
MALTLLSKTVATAGTRVALSAGALVVKQALVQVKSANTGKIYLGGITVSSALCIELGIPQAGATLPSFLLLPTSSANTFDLADIYIDSSVNLEGVNVLYEP